MIFNDVIKQKHGYHLFSLHCVLSYPTFNLDHLWVLLNKTKLYQILSRPTICYTAWWNGLLIIILLN